MKPIALIIMDGFGLAGPKDNAIAAARTPNLDYLFENCPTTKIAASGLAVGLPDGQMGNSEVGHTNIGAGRVVYQDLTRISKAITDGTFFENTAILDAVNHAKAHDSAVHVMGLLSDGGVHSHVEHLYAILEILKSHGVKKVFIHAFLDGRDVSPTSGKSYLQALQKKLNELEIGKIATVAGRYFAMDRDNRWERVEKVYFAMVCGVGCTADDPVSALEDSYKAGVTDEFFEPTIINDFIEQARGNRIDNNEPKCQDICVSTINENDSVIFFNFRPDRARQLTSCFVDANFSGFDRKKVLKNISFVCLTEYDKNLSDKVKVAFEPEELKNTLGEYLAQLGFTQLRIAETEKYAHVTFFFNGGVEKEYQGETRILVPSPKVATYDLKPEMSAFEVTERVIEEIEKNEHNVIVLNFANCDMVGHTGDFDAAVKAVETVDACVKSVVDKVLMHNGIAVITADHGNAEKMRDETGEPFTAHTTNLVPLCVAGHDCKLKPGGKLSDVAPTLLTLLGVDKPAEMLGQSLIE